MYHNVGDSMIPLIKQGRDLMVIKALKRPPKKYDAVLYKRENGNYIMHRIVGKNSDGFILCGDNQYDKEYGIKNEQILGLLTGVIRDGKEIKTDSYAYKFYAFFWCNSLYIRRFILKLKTHFTKQKGKLK